MANADIFLTVEGASAGVIKGESNAPSHIDEIEVSAWDWGMKASTALGGMGASTRTALSELRVTKKTDRATTSLMSMMRNNEVVKEAVLSVRRAGASGVATDYLTVTIKKGRVTSHQIGTESPGSAALVETLTFAFEEIEVSYSVQADTGEAGAQSTFNTQVHTD
jgi:type VI secretion system secreted protein Hcp